MAVVVISRQVAALGDEIAAVAAQKLGYKFVCKHELEQRIIALGFSEEKLAKYDEKKPGFFAALLKDRDEYLQYLQTAVLEFAAQNNCILIGRGAHIILEDVPSLISLRFVAKDAIRLQRLEREFSWNEKQAQQRIDESDSNRRGFDKSFFGVDIDDATHFHFVMNTGIINAQQGGTIIANLVRTLVTDECDKAGTRKIKMLLDAQHLVNKLIFEHKLAIEFLHAVIDGNMVTLHGVAESPSIVEQALSFAQDAMPGYTAVSAVSIVQDFHAYK
ncbi:MAG: cytidylate kinase-like family protein [Treponema sp.]|nr:cytidylate kinase-like family protein [Treponema sp.]